jgi:exopolysaccharide production protein ExoY
MNNGIARSSLPQQIMTLNAERIERSRRVVLIGDASGIAEAMEHPLLDRSAFRVMGAVALESDVDTLPEQSIRELISEEHAGALVVAGSLPRSLLIELGELSVLLGCRLLSLLPNTKDTLLAPTIMSEGRQPFVEVAIAPDQHRFDQHKRALDFLVASAALVLMLPVIGVAALMVALESRGGPFFGHVRIGRGGRRFRCWKLRTMHADAELRLQQERELFERYRENDFKLPDDQDPRITRVGRFLRRTSLDELPQLWNVIDGDMSLVGPRPIVTDELQNYRGDVLTLLSVRPGITGAWAVNGRHHLPYPRRAEVELAYVRNRSLWLDVGILFRTVGAILDPGFGLRDEEVASAMRSDALGDPPPSPEKARKTAP